MRTEAHPADPASSEVTTSRVAGQWSVLAILLACMAVTSMSWTVIEAALPHMAAAYSDLENAGLYAKLMISAPMFATIIAAPVIGLLGDRIGRVPLLALSLVLFTLAGVAGFWIESIVLLLASRTLAGLGGVGITNAVLGLVAQCMPPATRARALAIVAMTIPLSGPLWVILGGVLAEQSWRHPFLLAWLGLVPLAAVLFFSAKLRPQPSGAANVGADAEPDQAAAPAQSVLAAMKVTVPAIWTLLLLGFWMGVAGLLMATFGPFFAHDLGATDPREIGALIGGPSIVSVLLGVAILPVLAQRVSGPTLFTIAFVLIGAGLIVIALAGSAPAFCAGVMLTTLGLSLGGPALNLAIIDQTPASAHGLAFGLASAVLAFGNVIAPLPSQQIADWMGSPALFLWLGCVTSAGAITARLLLLYSHKQPIRKEIVQGKRS